MHFSAFIYDSPCSVFLQKLNLGIYLHKTFMLFQIKWCGLSLMIIVMNAGKIIFKQI